MTSTLVSQLAQSINLAIAVGLVALVALIVGLARIALK